MGAFHKVGIARVKNGSYKDKDGVEKNRYNEVGILLASPHGSQIIMSLHATAGSEQKFVYFVLDKGQKMSIANEDNETVVTDVKDYVPTDDEIPF